MTDAIKTPGDTAAETDKKYRERVDKLLALPAARSSGQFTPSGKALPSMDYDTCVEFIPVVNEGFEGALGEPQAAVMATSYCLRGGSAAMRPVCFAFNGGPGSASIWLHLGALGPKRVVVPDDGSMPTGPYTVSDNPLSWFEHFDMVFIDPPHTGWSLAASEKDRKRLLGVDGDVDALAEVMRLWLTRHRRWGSAVYLAGESYGTTRGAALADKLLGMGVGLSGLILISCAMDLQALEFVPANDLPYALFLPAFANVAQFHGMLKGPQADSPEAARQAAETFVVDDYLAALHRGSGLDATRRGKVAARLAELTGLPRALVESHNLRISDQVFFFDAMRDQGRIVGRLDARVLGLMGANRSRAWEFDPGIESIVAPYTMAAMAYFGEQLGVSIEQRYEVLSMATHKAWNWNRGEAQGNAFTSTTPDLARALRRNPNLRVFVASGRYDLGTPYSASDWSLAQLDVPPEVFGRIVHRYYDAGHMMYTRSEDLAQLKADLAAWLG
jgi:carboxypeptidase C (cathepsin A)